MTMSGASYAERAESDPMLTPEYMQRPCAPPAPAGGTTPRPISRRSLPTLPASRRALIQAGDHEILYSDAEMLCRALERAGVPCRFEVSEGMWHVFRDVPPA